MAMRVQLPVTRYATPEARREFFDQLEPQIEITGIDAASVTTGVPPLDGEERLLEVEGQPRARAPFVGTVIVSPRYFDVLGVPLVRGRFSTSATGRPASRR